MKKLLKWMGVAIAVPVLLFVGLAALLYFPPFQRWAVRQVAVVASEKTGMDVSVGSVRLRFPLDLSVGDVRVLHPNDSIAGLNDTIADIKTAVVDVQLLPLLRKQVVVDQLDLQQVRLNTNGFIAAARVKGDVEQLRIADSEIRLQGLDDPSVSEVDLRDVLLRGANVDVVLADSVPEDTTTSETRWKILARKARIEASDVRVAMPPADSLTLVTAHLGDATVSDGSFDLHQGVYRVGGVELKEGALSYENVIEKPIEGFDANHLQLNDLSLKAESLDYHQHEGRPSLAMRLRSLSFREKSGLDVKDVSGQLAMADGRLSVKQAKVETSESSLMADVDLSLDMFGSGQEGLSPVAAGSGTMKATLHAALGKQDLTRFMSSLPAGFRQKWPNQQLKVDGVVRGSMKNMAFSDLNVSLPTAFRLKASGTLQNLDDVDRLKADVDLDAQAPNVGFLKELLPADVRRDVNIPRDLALKGHVKADGQQYGARFTASEGGGTLGGNVNYDGSREAYEAHLQARQLALRHFLPNYALRPLTATVDLKGQGTDLLSPRTSLTAQAEVQQFGYEGYDLAGMTANATVRNGRGHATVNSQNDLLQGVVSMDALMSKNRLRGTVVADLAKADLQRLGITDSMMEVSGCAHLDIDSDLKQYHKVQGTVGDLAIKVTEYQGDKATGEQGNKVTTYRPGDLWLDVLTSETQTRAAVDCGDFHLNLDARGNYERLIRAGDKLVAEASRQYDERLIDLSRLRSVLPDAQLSIASGRDNFFVDLMGRYGYGFGSLNGNIVSSPVDGLNGRLHLESLLVDSILIDTVNLAIRSDSVRTSYQAQVRNNDKNPQYTFNALIDGIVQDRGTIFGTRLYDEHGDLGVRLGLQATMEQDGFMLRTYGKEPVLGYRTFQVNDSNYIYLGRDSRVSADVVLRADDGTGVQIYTNDDNEDAKQDITVSLHHFDLEKILSVIPYTPDVRGMLNGDFHLVQTDDQTSVSTDLGIQSLAYEGSPIGNLGTEFVYMPKGDGAHYVDGFLSLEGKEIATVSGTYRSDGYLDATVDLAHMPLSLLNGFIPDQIIGFEGYGEGSLTARGPLSAPVVDGEVYLDSAYMVSQPYGVRLRFDNDPVAIKGSRLLFENFNMYANNSSPLTTYGSLDFTNLDHMRLNMRMRAQNFLLIDSKENMRSEAYGKAYVNFFGSIGGEVSNLSLRGKLDVLGTTDLTYILRDSPLTTDNQLDELVKFTNFADTTEAVVTRPELSGFSMDMTLDVSKGAHVMAYLNADKSNFIDLMGGGTLRMVYTPSDNLRLTGRYTLANGEMKYSLPIIPLKTFTIQDGSYIEFTGDPMNPTLNIAAVEQVKTAVTSESGVGRSVMFNCGVNITKTLNDMGLEFTLDAPEDMQLHSELQSMSKEQRGKLAVTMLTTGMYLADGNTNGFSMNNALNTFLQSEINSITGNALRTLDFSVGLDNTTDATGNTSTNYSFKFAKRFWNNRLKVAVGGKVSTGAEIQNQNQSFFDNVTFEYRLDDTANKYVTLFYENNVYDWLDGYTQEYGVGFIWRRSLQHFKDIFSFGSEKQTLPTMPQRDSTSVARPTENNQENEQTE